MHSQSFKTLIPQGEKGRLYLCTCISIFICICICIRTYVFEFWNSYSSRGKKAGCTFLLVLIFLFASVFAFVCVRVLKLLFFTRKKGWLYLSISDSAICQTHLLQPLTMASILNTECEHWTLNILIATDCSYHFLFIVTDD